MHKLLLGVMLAAVASPALSATNIIDGDTLRIDGVTVRIVEIDTPETWQSRCENELVLGLKAKERLKEIIDSGPVRFEKTGIDRYHRILARVFAWIDGLTVRIVEIDTPETMMRCPLTSVEITRSGTARLWRILVREPGDG